MSLAYTRNHLSPLYGTPASDRTINLGEFYSTVAYPGEQIMFSAGAGALTQAGPGQDQRRKNFLIFMEACLKTCGGTGAANGEGWYTSSHTGTGNSTTHTGEVFVPGPFFIEPYDTAAEGATRNYAPMFVTNSGAWTMPAGITVRGTGCVPGLSGSLGGAWNETSANAGRIIVYNSYFGWNPAGGPVPGVLSPDARNVSSFNVVDLNVMRRGTTAGTAFLATHWKNPADSLTHLCQFFCIDSLLVEVEPGNISATEPAINAVEIRCGLRSQIRRLYIHGNGNKGWGLIYAPPTNATDWTTGQVSNIQWGNVYVQNSGKGIAIAGSAQFQCQELNFEQNPTWCRSRLLVGLGAEVQIQRLWMETVRAQDVSTHNAAVVFGAPIGEFTGAIVPTVTVSGEYNGYQWLGYVMATLNVAAPPHSIIKIVGGNVRVDSVLGANANYIFHIPVEGDWYTKYLIYDSRRLSGSGSPSPAVILNDEGVVTWAVKDLAGKGYSGTHPHNPRASSPYAASISTRDICTTNGTMSTTLVIDLPDLSTLGASFVGAQFPFLRRGTGVMRLTPSATGGNQKFLGQTVLKYLEIGAQYDYILLEIASTTEWMIVSKTGTVTYEP